MRDILAMSPDEIAHKYDRIVEQYTQARSSIIGLSYVERFIQLLSAGQQPIESCVLLDIGCGTGCPLTKRLVDSGAHVM